MANPFTGAAYSDALSRVMAALVEGKKMGLTLQQMQDEIARQERQQGIENEMARRQMALTEAEGQRAAGTYEAGMAQLQRAQGLQAELGQALQPRPPLPFAPPQMPMGIPGAGPAGNVLMQAIAKGAGEQMPREVQPPLDWKRIQGLRGQLAVEGGQDLPQDVMRGLGAPMPTMDIPGVGQVPEGTPAGVLQELVRQGREQARYAAAQEIAKEQFGKPLEQLGPAEVAQVMSWVNLRYPLDAQFMYGEAEPVRAYRPGASTEAGEGLKEERKTRSEWERDVAAAGSPARERETRITLVMPAQAEAARRRGGKGEGKPKPKPTEAQVRVARNVEAAYWKLFRRATARQPYMQWTIDAEGNAHGFPTGTYLEKNQRPWDLMDPAERTTWALKLGEAEDLIRRAEKPTTRSKLPPKKPIPAKGEGKQTIEQLRKKHGG